MQSPGAAGPLAAAVIKLPSVQSVDTGSREQRQVKQDDARLSFTIEWPIGTIRREYLDRIFFWNALDLARKLQAYSLYYNYSHIHQSISGNTPEEQAGKPRPACAMLDSYGWQQHCQSLFHTPIAA